MVDQAASAQPGLPAGADRRTAKRVSLVTQIRTTVGGETLVGYSKDISTGGVFVETEEPPEKGAEVTLRFRLSEDSPILEVRAAVAYRMSGEGMGLRFLDPPPELLRAIEQFVAQQ
jgi:uncharacterized protein (TIGR02266 family)